LYSAATDSAQFKFADGSNARMTNSCSVLTYTISVDLYCLCWPILPVSTFTACVDFYCQCWPVLLVWACMAYISKDRWQCSKNLRTQFQHLCPRYEPMFSHMHANMYVVGGQRGQTTRE